MWKVNRQKRSSRRRSRPTAAQRRTAELKKLGEHVPGGGAPALPPRTLVRQASSSDASFMERIQRSRQRIEESAKNTEPLEKRVQALRAEIARRRDKDGACARIHVRALRELDEELAKAETLLGEQKDVKRRRDDFERRIRPYVSRFNIERDMKAMRATQGLFDGKRQTEPLPNAAYMSYLADVDGDVPPIVVQHTDRCPKCDVLMRTLPKQSELACPRCGVSRTYIDGSMASMSYEDEVEYTTYVYARIMHMKDRLKKFQAKEGTVVPEHVLRATMQRLWSQGVRSPEEITSILVDRAMHEAHLSPWYTHYQQVTERLTGRPAPRLSAEEEDLVLRFYAALQRPFEKYKAGRKNFLPCRYVMYREFQYLGFYHLLPHLDMNYEKKKILEYDDIWRNMCGDLGLEFLPLELV
jgi:hypothetical protein